ncbi:MAG: MFS transporter [Verrucomicrobiota bacterium]
MTLNPAEEKAAMRNILLTQCLEIIALGTTINGTLLLYLTSIGASAVRTMIYLALPSLLNALLLLPAAYLADRYGKKLIGQAGITVGIIGWGIVALAAFSQESSETIVVIGIIFASCSIAMFSSGWFSLLSPIVPAESRGRFFGQLRLTVGIVSLSLSVIFAWLLSLHNSIAMYQGIYAIATLAYIARWFTYRRIPELEPPVAKVGDQTFSQIFAKVFRTKNFAAFCSYMFLLSLFTAGAATLFALVENRVLAFSDSRIILLSNITLVGSMFGMFMGGRIIDRHGTRSVFAGCHIMLAQTMVAFLLRVFVPLSFVPFYLGILHFMLGAALGAVGIAMTTELLGILPNKNKSVASSMFIIYQMAGTALSGLLPAWFLKIGILKSRWGLSAAQQLSSFDGVLLCFSLMTLILVATLGLVPSMLKKSESTSLGV